jgi:hypothetical protein
VQLKFQILNFKLIQKYFKVLLNNCNIKKMDNKNHKSINDMKDQKIKVDKRDQKHPEKNEKNNKVDRPVKWAKNRHQFVVSGILKFYNFLQIQFHFNNIIQPNIVNPSKMCILNNNSTHFSNKFHI